MEKSNTKTAAMIKGECYIPIEWVMYGPVGSTTHEPDLRKLSAPPPTLNIDGGQLSARDVWMTRCRRFVEIDIKTMLGCYGDDLSVYLMTVIQSERETEVTLGAGADWRMKCWVNGDVVCDTLVRGNAIADRLNDWFTVKLKKGANLLAVKVVSGSRGWELQVGGPCELHEDLMIEDRIREDLPEMLLPPRIERFNDPRLLPEHDSFVLSGNLARTPGGRIWTEWSGGEDGHRAYKLLASSDDDGQSWSKPRFIIREPRTRNGFLRSVKGGPLWTDPQGRLWLFFSASIGSFDGRAGVWATVCQNPDDDVPAWSQPRRIGDGLSLNKPIVLRGGEWLLATDLFEQRNVSYGCANRSFPELDPWRMVNFLVSSDRGTTWVRRGGVCVDAESCTCYETVVLEKSSGELLCLLRTNYGLAESRSPDGGFNWSRPRPSALKHTPSRIFTQRLASGRMLLVKHGLPDEDVRKSPSANDTRTRYEGVGQVRNRLMALLSDDDGETWRGGLLLDERTCSYPDGFQSDDGSIYVAYDQRRQYGQVLMAVFTEDDVIAGKPVSGKCRLKIPVVTTGNKQTGESTGRNQAIEKTDWIRR